MNIYFYRFSKRNNSTKIVDVTGETYSGVQLKGQTDMIAPTLLINAIPNNWNPIYNYVYIPFFKRYYFVNNWRWLNGVWECECIVDALASWRIPIGESSEYVIRAASEYNSEIPDTAYPVVSGARNEFTYVPSFFTGSAADLGFYVVGIINGEATAAQGAITYYQMTAEEMSRFKNYMLSNSFLTEQGLVNLADFIPADATKVIYNPIQYIASCEWFPMLDSAIDGAWKTYVNTIPFGWWTPGTTFYGHRLKKNVNVYNDSIFVNLHWHPQDVNENRGAYLSYSPYTERILHYEPFGDIVISDQLLTYARQIELNLVIDWLSGVGYLTIYAYGQRPGESGGDHRLGIIYRQSRKISVSIQLAQVGTDYYGAQATLYQSSAYEFDKVMSQHIDLSSIGNAIKSGFQTGANIGMLKDYHTYVATGNYLKAKAPQVISSGSNGSMSAYSTNAYLDEYFYIIAADDTAHLGRPLYETKRIDTLSGFIMVQNPDVNLPCTETERTMIANFMANGFFWE